jgi:hypothetical protein
VQTPGKIRNDGKGEVADDHYHRYRDDVRSKVGFPDVALDAWIGVVA